MLARCARCQVTFTTDRFGVQQCPHCGSEILLSDPNAPAAPPPSPGATTGSSSEPPPPGGVSGSSPEGGAPPPFSAPPSSLEEAAPFARRSELGRVSAFAQTWKLASLEPQRFFRSVRIDRPWAAVLFGVIAATLSHWLDAVYNYLVGASMLGIMEQFMRNAPQGPAPFNLGWIQAVFGVPVLLGRILAAPVLAFVGLYLTAALFHLMLMVFRGAGRGFDATLTAVGYSAGVLLLGAIPMCGGLVASVWFSVLAIIGLAEAQRCGSGKATAAVFLPGLLFCLCCCGGFFAFLGTLRGLLGQHSGVEL